MCKRWIDVLLFHKCIEYYVRVLLVSTLERCMEKSNRSMQDSRDVWKNPIDRGNTREMYGKVQLIEASLTSMQNFVESQV